MKKSYLFTFEKYYEGEELDSIKKVVRNYWDLFNDGNVATLDFKEDVTVVMKDDEIPNCLHMVINDSDKYVALPKTLSRPKEFVAKFVRAMAKKVDDMRVKVDVESIRNKLGAEAEGNLLDYISDDEVAPAPTTSETVTVNGNEVTDEAEKEAVKAAIKEKSDELSARFAKLFGSYFNPDLLTSDSIREYVKNIIDSVSK